MTHKLNKPIIFIFSTALLLRIGMFIAIEANSTGFANRFISPDVLEYHHIAQNLANNGIFSDSQSAPFNPRLERTPLYPLFIAAGYLSGDFGGHLAIVFQILLSSLTGVLTYWIGRQWFSERIAFIAGMLLAFDYTGILYSNTFFSETLFTLLFLLHIYFLGKYVQSGQRSALSRCCGTQGFEINSSQYSIDNLQYSIITLALATLTRPVSIYWIFCLVPIVSWQHRFKLAKPVLHFSLLTFTFLLLLFPWALRYHSFTGKWLISSQQEEVFWWNTHNLHKLYAGESRQPSVISSQRSAVSRQPSVVSNQFVGFAQGSVEAALFTSSIRNPASGIRNPELVLSPDPGKASGSMISSSTFQFQLSNFNFISEETIQAIGRDSQHYLKGMINFFSVISSSDVFRILGIDATLIGDPEYGSTRFAFLNQLLSQKRPAELAVMGILGCYLIILYGFAGFGGYTLLQQKHYFIVFLLAMILGYFLLASAPAAFTAKYRMPVLPVIALFAAVGLAQINLHMNNRKTRNVR